MREKSITVEETMSTGSVPDRKVRGSQKLLARLAKNGDTPSVDEIKQALNFSDAADIHIPNWLVRGTPADWLQLDATINAPISQLNNVVSRFIALNDSTIQFKILTHGIPVPDLATIIVRNTPEAE